MSVSVEGQVALRSRLAVTLTVLAVWLLSVTTAVAADDTPTPTAAPPATGTDTPTLTSTPTPTPTVVIKRERRQPISTSPETMATPVRARTQKRHPKVEGAVRVKPHATPERRRPKKRARRHPTPTATPSPTPTRTPAFNLQTDDTVTPVSCNGPPKRDAGKPFLYPPYAGWTSIGSFFDHDSPDFTADGLVITATGLEAHADREHRASDFPAYWSTALRQYVYYDGHNGYDFSISYQPVYAAAAGKVLFAGWEYADLPDHGYGRMVIIDHRNGYLTLYGHFSKVLVQAGQRVKRLQRIGVSGDTGHSTSPHLHFSVFHNCTPTDPYGWSGSGPDPLQNYQGETSVNLWVYPPRVSNPIPNWPGIATLPPSSLDRLLLLRLPSTRRGTGAFTAALQREARAAASALGPEAGNVKMDLLRGALDVRGFVTASRLYALPYVASVASPDAARDARADVLAALARAGLAARQRSLALGGLGDWTGFLLQWDGRTFLVGKGPRSSEVALQAPRVGHGDRLEVVRADPVNGAFAVDLGPMSKQEVASLLRTLRGPVRRAHSAMRGPMVRSPAHRSTRDHEDGFEPAQLVPLGALLLALVVVGYAAWYWRERNRRQAEL